VSVARVVFISAQTFIGIAALIVYVVMYMKR